MAHRTTQTTKRWSGGGRETGSFDGKGGRRTRCFIVKNGIIIRILKEGCKNTKTTSDL
jgi:hypothetical protein